MDIFRIAKPAFYLYQSQQEKPMIQIASYWNAASDYKNLTVYSNCDEVALYLNNQLIERKKPTLSNNSDHLKHAPFVFQLEKFEAGELKAMGYRNNSLMVQDTVRTAAEAYQIKLSYDKSGKELKADGADVVFVYASVCDANGNTVERAQKAISFKVSGAGRLLGQNPIISEAGIATILLQSTSNSASELTIEAHSPALQTAKLTIKTTN